MSYNPANSDTRKHQNADGQAHLAYFDVRTQASIVWNGYSKEMQVCLGGYGEPVHHVIKAPTRIHSPRFPIVLADFEEIAKAHAETLPTISGMEDA